MCFLINIPRVRKRVIIVCYMLYRRDRHLRSFGRLCRIDVLYDKSSAFRVAFYDDSTRTVMPSSPVSLLTAAVHGDMSHAGVSVLLLCVLPI